MGFFVNLPSFVAVRVNHALIDIRSWYDLSLQTEFILITIWEREACHVLFADSLISRSLLRRLSRQLDSRFEMLSLLEVSAGAAAGQLLASKLAQTFVIFYLGVLCYRAH